MEKIVAIPRLPKNTTNPFTIWSRWLDKINGIYWGFRCRRFSYVKLLQMTISSIEEILNANSLKDSFYKNLNFEIELVSKNYWKFELAKAFTGSEENIIMILYEKASFGELTYSITFENKDGKITGIQNMFQGFCIDSYFHDKESDLLNPNVLAALLTAKSALSKGSICELKISNKPIFFENEFGKE